MIKRVLRSNLDQTLADMERQTGLRPGGPTQRCHPVVVGALTGAKLDFRTVLPGIRDQEGLEYRKGLIRAHLFTFGVTPAEAIRGIFEQDTVPGFDAVLVSGQAVVAEEQGNHIIAVVADNQRPHTIVDSLKPGAQQSCSTLEAVDEYLEERFVPGGVLLCGLALNEAGRGLRSDQEQWLRLGAGVVACVPSLSGPVDRCDLYR